jgi:hypothetical protein
MTYKSLCFVDAMKATLRQSRHKYSVKVQILRQSKPCEHANLVSMEGL